ncbi:MAG: Fe-Mn family superoxide dismutase [Simkaniaceae bacterium]|nr:Fe-Mn family superoxide dismutase [Simkaniaceae bacterium]
MKKLLLLFMLCAHLSAKESFKAKDYDHLLTMPGFTKELLQMHFKLYAGYVKATNTIGDLLTEFAARSDYRSPEYGSLKRMYGWEYDGMRLHEYYFDNLGGNGSLNSKTPLYRQIIQDFGSFEKWKADFVGTGMMRGIGWAILYFDGKSGALTNAWINEHDLGHLAGNAPILVMDVFEHAYITEYGLDRAKYIDAFFKNIDWEVCIQRFKDAK